MRTRYYDGRTFWYALLIVFVAWLMFCLSMLAQPVSFDSPVIVTEHNQTQELGGLLYFAIATPDGGRVLLTADADTSIGKYLAGSEKRKYRLRMEPWPQAGRLDR